MLLKTCNWWDSRLVFLEPAFSALECIKPDLCSCISCTRSLCRKKAFILVCLHVRVALQLYCAYTNVCGNLLPQICSHLAVFNVTTKSHINVHKFGLLLSNAPRPGPCLQHAGNVWSTWVEEEARNAWEEMCIHHADQSQCLWCVLLRY